MKESPLILAIESATRAGSVAVARGEGILASTTGDASASHSTDLIENIDAVLRGARVTLQDVDLFAVAVGPGSFTGLRIGLATVKSLAVALGKNCIGISTLGAVARAAGQSERTVALLAAGRGEVFAQLFSVQDDIRPLDEAAHISPKLLWSKYGSYPSVLWAGEGAHAQVEFLRNEAEQRQIPFHITRGEKNGWSIAPQNDKIAEAVALLACREYRAGKMIEPDELRADYVRPSDAEIKAHA